LADLASWRFNLFSPGLPKTCPASSLLDDPFTDLDATRRSAAVHSIGAFAKNHQVLFFTCHPEHARLSLSVSQRNACSGVL
jgi:uncharacterized protein YhaN